MENTINTKKPSMDLWFNFIESLILRYHLEDNFIIGNPSLLKELNSIDPSGKDYFLERSVIKSIYNKNDYFQPTLILRKILTDLINKHIDSNNLTSIIQASLGIPLDVAEKISSDVKNNQQIQKEMEINFTNESLDEKTNIYLKELEKDANYIVTNKSGPRGINQDLL